MGRKGRPVYASLFVEQLSSSMMKRICPHPPTPNPKSGIRGARISNLQQHSSLKNKIDERIKRAGGSITNYELRITNYFKLPSQSTASNPHAKESDSHPKTLISIPPLTQILALYVQVALPKDSQEN